MEETKETEVPTQTLSESSDQEEKSSEPVLKKAKRVLSEKQKAILSLGREKAQTNRENKTKAKVDGMLEAYLKQKSEESKTKPQKKQKITKAPTPPPLSPLSSSSGSESSSEEDFSSDASSEVAPLPVLRRTKNCSIPRKQNVQSVALSFK